MSQVCNICNHPNRLDIDKRLAGGGSVTRISREYDVSKDALHNHKEKHISRQLSTHVEIQSRIHSGELLTKIDECLRVAEEIQRTSDNDRTRLAAGKEVREHITFLFDLVHKAAELLLKQAEVEAQQRVFCITPEMSPVEAAKAYGEMLAAMKTGPIITLPAKQHVELAAPGYDDEPSAAPIRRRTRLPADEQTQQASQQASQQDDQDGTIGPAILDWQPMVPSKASGGGIW